MLKSRLVLVVATLVMLAGCAVTPANPRILLQYEKGPDGGRLSDLMSRAGGGPVAVIDLGRTAWVSHHLAVVRDAESPHYHRFHDLTVTVLRGQGTMDLDGKKYPLEAGDVVHVNRGLRHFFRNTGKEPAAAFVIFSPPYDGRDTVTAEVLPDEAKSAPAPAKKSWWQFWSRE
jgi:mannose-6-phosphate isomerase-like protein (cupin superfamily)